MINPHELNSHSQHKLTEWHDKAEMQQLAQEAQGRAEREAQGKGFLRRLAGRLSLGRLVGRTSLDARSW